MAVDGADVFQPEILKQTLRRHHVFDALLHSVQSVIQRATYEGSALKESFAPCHEALVVARGAQCCEMVGEAADRRRIRPLVVVHHDHHRAIGRRDVVERFPRHPPGQRTIADDRDHVT